jgi:hypothetical protein
LCLAGAFVEVGLKLLRVGMDHNGSLNTSFLPDIRSLSLVVTDTIRDDRLSIEGVITTAGNLETALLRTGFKDLFIWVLTILIILDENCAFQLHNIKQNDEQPKIRCIERRV